MECQPDHSKEEKRKIEQRVLEACGHAWTIEKPNLSEIAREFDVNYQNFRNRYLGHNSKHTRPGANVGGSVTMEKLHAAANLILSKGANAYGQEEFVPLSHSLTKRFLDRHPELKTVTQKPLEMARMIAQQPQKVVDYFDRLQEAMLKYGIGEHDLWNMDEAGFRVGMGGKRVVITFTSNRKEKHSLASEMERESLTIIEAINAAGQVIPPFIIFQAKTHLAQFFRNDLEPSTVFSTSEKGFTTDIIAMDWIEHFDKRTKGMQRGEYRMLLIDGHGSHGTEDFIQYCTDNKIVLMMLPALLTYLLQPLDLKVFQPYKHFHRKSVNSAASLGLKSFNKADFFAALPKIRKETMKYSTIRSAWREAGIVPWNPGKVLAKMSDDAKRKEREEGGRPTTPPRQLRDITNVQTPTSSGGLRRMVNQLDITPRNDREFSPLLDKVMRGSLGIAMSSDVLKRDFAAALATQKEQMSRRSGGQKRVRTDGGTINVGTGRKIDERLREQALDAKKKREWERISANLYEVYKEKRLTEAELPAQLDQVAAQAKKRKPRSDKGVKRVKPAQQAEAENEPSEQTWYRNVFSLVFGHGFLIA